MNRVYGNNYCQKCGERITKPKHKCKKELVTGCEMMEKILGCDDDHFASSEIKLRICPRPKGIKMEIFAQFGKENYAFLHMDELDKMINTLIEMRNILDKLQESE